MVQMSEVIKAN